MVNILWFCAMTSAMKNKNKMFFLLLGYIDRILIQCFIHLSFLMYFSFYSSCFILFYTAAIFFHLVAAMQQFYLKNTKYSSFLLSCSAFLFLFLFKKNSFFLLNTMNVLLILIRNKPSDCFFVDVYFPVVRFLFGFSLCVS